MVHLRKTEEPQGSWFVARGVCADCHREQDIRVSAPTIDDVHSPLKCPLCEGEFYSGVVEVEPNPIKAADITGAFQ